MPKPQKIRQKLPHIYPKGACFFVTFTLFDAVPKVYLDKLKNSRDDDYERITHRKDVNDKERELLMEAVERQYWTDYHEALDAMYDGTHLFKEKALAQIIVDKLKQYDGLYYTLCAYVIMSNHVHILIDFSVQLANKEDKIAPNKYKDVDKVMQLIKGGSAKLCNDWLRTHNRMTYEHIWFRESYDRYIRNERHYLNCVNYI
jgi:putative transposase